MSSLEEIAALLGFVAFVGLAVLVFLTFQQGRHLRRLRDWAGNAPERAAALAARGEEPEEPDAEELSEEEIAAVNVVEPTRFGLIAAAVRERWAEVDRRLPVEPKLLFGGIAAIVLGIGIATSGFGLFGSDSGNGANQASQGGGQGGGKGGNRAEGNQGEKSKQVTEVAVLNGTAPPGGTGVPGVADRLTADVESAGFEVGTVDNADSFSTSTVMWTGAPENEAQAQELADGLSAVLGTTAVVEMSPEVEALAGGAEIALIVGQDDATI